MRGLLTVSALLALGLGSSGCFLQTSVFPFVSSENAVILPTLAGEWIETGDDDPDVLELTPTGPSPTDTWRLRYRDDATKPPAIVTVRLGRIGDHLVWDMTVPDADEPDLAKVHRLPLHSLARLALEDDRLEIAFLEPRSLADRAHAGELDVAHLDLGDDGVLLTAPTEALQAAILEHWSDAFGDTGVFVRRTR